MRRGRLGGPFGWLDRLLCGRRLGAPLPAAARGVRFADWRPSGDLAYREVLARFEMGREDYREWSAALGLRAAAAAAPPGAPAVWRAPPEIAAPAWWDPSLETPADAAWRRVGAYGTLTVKWERGAVYAHLIDTGQRADETGA